MKPVVFLARSEPTTWVPPTARVLAYFHGGRVFVDTLPLLARVGLLVAATTFTLWWFGQWGAIYRDYERWSLIGAALVHFAVLALAYLFARIAWLRIDHLRRLPASDDVALCSLPILLRLTAELLFVFVVTLSLRVFAMPAPPPPPVLGTGGFMAVLGEAVPNPFAWMAFGTWTTAGVAFFALFGVLFLYGIANVIEVSSSIEKNTRQIRRRSERDEHFAAWTKQ